MNNPLNLNKLDKLERLKIIIFVIWLISSIFLYSPLIGETIKQYQTLHHLTPEERANYQIGNELFAFIIFCKRNLPEKARCFFYNFRGKYVGTNLNNFREEISRIKTGMIISYFLYPLKIYNLSYNNISDILGSVDFIIVYKTNEYDFSDFKTYVRYDENSLILKRK